MKNIIQSLFKIKKNNSSIRREIIAGVTVFFSMAYIVSVHPQIISQTGMPFSACVTATILVCFFSSIAMGVYANNPIVLGPSISLSSFFTFTLVKKQGIDWEIALGSTFWVGVIFFVLSLFKVRERLTLSVPHSLKNAIVSGIGLFLAFIGLKEGGVIIHSEETFLQAQSLNAESGTFLIGLAVTFLMLVLKVRGVLLTSIIVVAFLCFPLGRLWGDEILLQYKGVFSLPDFSLFAQMDLVSSLKYSFWPVLFSIAFVDLFESLSGILGIAKSGPLMTADGQPKSLKKFLFVFFGVSHGYSRGRKNRLNSRVCGFLIFAFSLSFPFTFHGASYSYSSYFSGYRFLYDEVGKGYKLGQAGRIPACFSYYSFNPSFLFYYPGNYMGLLVLYGFKADVGKG